MTKITCLGDSIRLQYAPVVEQLLGDDFQIYSPSDNCRFVKYMLRAIFDWRENMKDSRIVHFNNGLWDLCDLYGDGLFTSPEEYTENILRVVDQLQKRHEIVLFATITPVRPEHEFIRPADVAAFNEMIVPKLREKGVWITDLYTAVNADPQRYVCDDYIHLSEEGIRLCAELVADNLRKAAAALR